MEKEADAGDACCAFRDAGGSVFAGKAAQRNHRNGIGSTAGFEEHAQTDALLAILRILPGNLLEDRGKDDEGRTAGRPDFLD